MDSGIYVIKNCVNNKLYFGQTVNFKDRKKQHWLRLKRDAHGNSHLQNSWNKYGEKNFTFEIVEYCEKILLDEKEDFYISKYKTTNCKFGYNKKEGGSNGSLSQESRDKISKTLMGNIPWNKGIPASEETKKLWSKIRTGKTHKYKPHTQETKNKISENLSGKQVLRKKTDDNKSKYKGVSFHGRKNKWFARLQYCKKVFYLGEFTEEIDAARAYDKKCYEFYGDKAKLNFPEDYNL